MTLRRTLIDGAAVFGIGLTEKQADACLVYLVELEKWNRKMSLTAIRDEQEMIIKHFLDSFSFVRGFDPVPGAKLLDMGSGAGFPALPLKIVFPDLEITMVEAVQKKAVFLRHMVRTLAVTGAEVADKRTGALGDTYRSAFDIVTARAFASMEDALREGSVFLRPRGVMVLSRGPAEQVREEAARSQNMAIENRVELALPVSGDRRAIWVFRKGA